MKRRLITIVILIAAAALYSGHYFARRSAADATQAAGAATNIPARSGAMNYGISASDLTSNSSAVLNQRLATMQALGVGWIRLDFRWSSIQPNNPRAYNWTSTDRVVKAADAHNLKILGIIDSTPAWATAANCSGTDCQPASPAAFGRFSAAAATHYKSMGIHNWEIWNEENSSTFWQPAPSVTAYAQILQASYASIKKVDPLALILTGGLAHTSSAHKNISPTDYLKKLYALGAEDSFDAVASHPYAYPQLPSATDTQGPFALHQIMIDHGDAAKQIWITEIGAPTSGPPGTYVSETTQADTVTAAAKVYNQSWVGPIFWYSDIDAGTSKTTNENFFGLISADGQQKPAYNTLEAVIAGDN